MRVADQAMGSPGVPDRAAVAVLGLVATTLLGAGSNGVAVQGLTARVAPEFPAFQWSPSLGFADQDFLGGSASLGFGRYVLLRGSYLSASGMPTALSASGYTGVGVRMIENSVDASILSAEVQLRLGSGKVAPLVFGGGGIMDLSPEGRDEQRQIIANYGGVVDLRLLPWLDGQLLFREYRFRLDRSTIAGASANGIQSIDPERNDLKSSFALSASVGARIGGTRPSARADRLDMDVGGALTGGDGLIIPVEVTASVLRFADALAIGDQPLDRRTRQRSSPSGGRSRSSPE